MSDRKLAHVERVVAVNPIEKADNLEVATVLGWQCVVKKGEVKVGDLVAYVEVDSILPAIPYFEFMATRKYRVRTIKLRGQISQGLVISLERQDEKYYLPHTLRMNSIASSWVKEGDDVTEYLGITKWLSPSERYEQIQELRSRKKHNPIHKFLVRFDWYRKLFHVKGKCSFPDWIKKTDEERIQNIPHVLKNKNTCAVSEKIDGQSATYWVKKTGWFGKKEFGVCSRTIRKFESDGSNWSACARQHDIKKKLLAVGRDIAIQGEIVCDKVQGGKYKGHVDSPFDFFVFNVYDIANKLYYTPDEVIVFCNIFDFKHVPYIDRGFTLPDTVQEMIEYAKGKSVVNPNIEREGVVVRSIDGTISFKAINPNFLLKYED